MALRTELKMMKMELQDVTKFGEKSHLVKQHNEDFSQNTISKITYYAQYHQLYSDGHQEKINATLENVSHDAINIISQDIWYKENQFYKSEDGKKKEIMSTGLIALRLTSKALNELVEKTPAGNIARLANDLELHPTLAKCFDDYYPVIENINSFAYIVTGCTGGMGGAAGGATGGFYAGYAIYSHCGCISSTATCSNWPVLVFALAGIPVGMAVGTPLCVGANALATLGLYACEKKITDDRTVTQKLREQITAPTITNSI